MKNNNKNRKLNFIRAKNNLRLGITKFYCSEKASNSIELNKDYFNRLINIAKKSCYKHYKINLKNIQILEKQIIEDDFVKDLHTNVIILHN